MGNYRKLPTAGATEYRISGELIYGICPFSRMVIDWSANKGICSLGKWGKGKITNLKVKEHRLGFTADFAVESYHRGKMQKLNGKFHAWVTDHQGSIAFKVTGLPDWRDNTTFEARVPMLPISHREMPGRNFQISIISGAGAKAIGVAQLGTVVIRDTDAHIEHAYPLVAAGIGFSVGVTAASTSNFKPVTLKKPCLDWQGTSLEMMTSGVNAIIGANTATVYFHIKNPNQTVSTETDGIDLGIGLDVSANYMTTVLGKLGMRLYSKRY